MAQPDKLICPECGGELREVYAAANYGRVLLLDQCNGCGGVWFDRWELYFVTDKSIKDLEAVDASFFAAPVAVHGARGLCPRCEKELAKFTDPNLPKDALIERCPGCNGLWLNRGELGKYAAHRRAFRGIRGDEPGTAETSALKHLQKELKIGDIAMPTTLELAASELKDAPPMNTKEVAKDMAFLALQSLMRLVFKF